jgi:hypothetical protein
MTKPRKAREIRYLGDVRRLVLRPGDVVVLLVPGSIEPESAKRLSETMRANLPGHKVLVLADGLKIGVMGPA